MSQCESNEYIYYDGVGSVIIYVMYTRHNNIIVNSDLILLLRFLNVTVNTKFLESLIIKQCIVCRITM